MSKKYNYKDFTFKTLKDGELFIRAWTYEYSTGWGHKCYYYTDNSNYAEARKTYYNRTWECFTYESLIHSVIDRLYPNKSQKLEHDFIVKQVEAIAKHEHEKAEAWFNTFKSLYNSLSDNMKKTLEKSDIILNTTEEAETVLKSAKMFDLMQEA